MSELLKRSAQYVTGLGKRWHGVESLSVAVLRTELLTDGAVGNKAFKLAPTIERFSGEASRGILSFGGVWSNHLHALAYLCSQYAINTVGVVRASSPVDNYLLRSAQQYGMELHFLSRQEYRRRDDREFCRQLCEELGCDVWIPEGGSTDDAVEGCESIAGLITESGFNPTVVAVAVGTGATFSGIVRKLPPDITVIGLPVVRDDKVPINIRRWVQGSCGAQWQIAEVVAPRYGSANRQLLQFIVDFHTATGVVLDPIYTGKVFRHCLGCDFTRRLPAGTRLLLIHTGGLLGGFGFEAQFLACANATAYLCALRALSEGHIDFSDG